ncbi:MAG: hypothetical protein ACRC2T_05455 [Thermoguttaceae bacterium]
MTKNLILHIGITILSMFMGSFATGQQFQDASEELKFLENDNTTELLNHFGIAEGSKSKAAKNKRVVIAGEHFDNLPKNVALSNITTHFLRRGAGAAEIADPDLVDIEKKIFINADAIFELYAMDIRDPFSRKHIGSVGALYTNSEYLARRILASEIAVKTNRLLDRGEFTLPKDIGDDYCFRRDDGDARSRIHFVRDFTIFSIELDAAKEVDIEKLARCIDQRFAELNTEINKKPPKLTLMQYAQDVKSENEMRKVFDQFILTKEDFGKQVEKYQDDCHTPVYTSYEFIGKPECSTEEDKICFYQEFSLDDGTRTSVDYMILKTPEDAMKAANCLVSDAAWTARIMYVKTKEQLGLEKYAAAFYYNEAGCYSLAFQCENVFVRIHDNSNTREKGEILQPCCQPAKIIIERIKKKGRVESSD